MSAYDIGWDLLLCCDPQDVCKRSSATFDENAERYLVKSFNEDIAVSLNERHVGALDGQRSALLERTGEFLVPSILWYLAKAQAAPLSGTLVSATDIPGGQIFVKGVHVLPVRKIKEKYGDNLDDLLEKGAQLGGQQISYGDASLQLFPVPRIPISIVCWKADEDFPFKASVLFDSTCSIHLPTDMLWSLAMATVLAIVGAE